MQLRKVADEKPKVLLIHVKGRRNVVARAAEVSHKSLNKGDAFVLVDAATRKVSQYTFSLISSFLFVVNEVIFDDVRSLSGVVLLQIKWRLLG